jgi:hypothetical protein
MSDLPNLQSMNTEEGVGADIPVLAPATVQPLGCTLYAYAEAKRPPEAFLKELGLSEISYQDAPAVRIPYRDTCGGEPAVRFRIALRKNEHGDNRFRWKSGSKPLLYGLWRMQPEPFIVVVEGESDCHTLWHHGINAVGLPGAGNWNEGRDAHHLASYGTIYVVIEPDHGGETMLAWVSRSALRDRIRLVRLDGFKDPSEMHVADPDPERFQQHWRAALDVSVPWTAELEKQQDAAREAAWISCHDLATSPDILSRFAAELLRAGVVGVEQEGMLLYLAVTSRLLDRPISVAVKGPSSAGKSFLVEKVLSFFPDEAYYALTAMSERALAYGEEPLQHRMLVLYEAEGMSGETTSYLIRSLLSEGCVRYETVEKTAQGLGARLIKREGPTGLIVTTTRDGLHPENETRLISLTLADGREQTRAILRALADEDKSVEVKREPWLALQQWIASGQTAVTIPFARELIELIPPVAVRLRRDIKVLLNLIRAHALLHQATRQRDETGRVIATLQDFAAVYALVAESIADGVQASVPDSVGETVKLVGRIAAQAGSATVLVVAQAHGLDKSAASRRCQTAQRRGYIRNEETSKGKPARYVLAEPLAAEHPVLPHPDVLARALSNNRSAPKGCTVATHMVEDTTPPPPSAQEPVPERRRIVLWAPSSSMTLNNVA